MDYLIFLELSILMYTIQIMPVKRRTKKRVGKKRPAKKRSGGANLVKRLKKLAKETKVISKGLREFGGPVFGPTASTAAEAIGYGRNGGSFFGDLLKVGKRAAVGIPSRALGLLGLGKRSGGAFMSSRYSNVRTPEYRI
jgi:hypothetical protein